MTDQDEQPIMQQHEIENACVVCFKPTVIYSIGCCNHPVCFECSARMRCLCLQNECPICRQDLPKVIFTKTIEQFLTLDRQIRSGLFEKKFKILFAEMDIQRAFYNLLEHRCPICPEDERPFIDFHKLKEHVRKVHERFYCEICTENLKIFSSERRCYTRQELAHHRRVGDLDNKSHRGHPRCDYCELRYLDKDELFRHLRREHYFCHLCDADGKNLYYGTIQEMRQHFKAEHFLCEEDDCVTEEFTAVFRSEIDLRAHKAVVHSRGMSKIEARQTRTLDLDFSYAPRGRQGNEGGERRGGRFTRDTQREFDNREIPEQQIVQQPPVKIDAKSEAQFPSLAPSVSSSTAGSQVQLANSVRHVVYGQAGIKKTKENFPALGGQSNPPLNSNNTQQQQPRRQASASSLFKAQKSNQPPAKQQQAAPKNQNRAADFPTLPQNTSTKLSSTFMSYSLPKPSTSSTTPVKTAPKTSDFPTLSQNASKLKAKEKLMEDMVEFDSNVDRGLVSAKHRNLMNDYVSIASQMTKVQLVKQKEEVAFDNTPKAVPKLNSTNNFPTLGSGNESSDQTTSGKLPNWISAKPTPTKQPQKNINVNPKVPPQSKQQNSNGVKKIKDEKKSKEKPKEVLSSKNKEISVPPPPGFKKADVVTFTKFIAPPDAAKRNEALVQELERILKTHEQMQEFKVLSQLFRNGSYFARSYYESCKGVLKEKFDTIFPELIVLLPDIEKQQKLYRIHLEEANNNPGGNQGKKKKFLLDVCPTCQQVLLSKDFNQHLKAHPTENQFSKNLNNSTEVSSLGTALNN